MPDRVLFAALAAAAVVIVGIGVYWPQGLGARSPAPFGHPVAPLPSSDGDSGGALDMTSGLTGPAAPQPGR